MKIAVIQHRIRGSYEEDIGALAASISNACSSAARVIVCPWIASLAEESDRARTELFSRLEGCPDGTAVLIPFRAAEREQLSVHDTPIGSTALLLGDECVDAQAMEFLSSRSPEAVVMRPRSESDLQAEAFLEHAIGLSASVAGLVAVAECVGAEVGEPGRGGSAIAILGEVVAEAAGEEDEVLLVDVAVPIEPPEPREPLPVVPPILEQRVARHEGHKMDVGYLADLS